MSHARTAVVHRFNIATKTNPLSNSLLKSEQVDHGLRADWDKLIRFDSHLIPYILLMQRTMRIAKVIPVFGAFAELREWRAIRAATTGELQRKFRAWWNVIFESMRNIDDQSSVKLAMCYVVQRQLEVQYGKHLPVYPAQAGVNDIEHAEKIREAVLLNFQDLMPTEIVPGASVSAILAPKLEKGR